MTITYLGHSSFKLKGKKGTVVSDPYHEYVGFKMPGISADIVTISHDHKDHNAFEQILGTSRRKKSFLIQEAGEYEVGGISVFGTPAYHDDQKGSLRGQNIIFTILIDHVSVCHLGDLGHELTPSQIESIGNVDVLLIPVGGVYTIGPKQAAKLIHTLEPAYAVPMHYRTEKHEPKVFGELATLDDFLKEYGAEPRALAKLEVDKSRLPEETELVVLTPPA